ncbi:MAG TPA: DUF4476 domain-containing protein [Bacteroidia bacterium]|nr:DUF4476 domain-containing protein [Bacteroidia bacterium]
MKKLFLLLVFSAFAAGTFAQEASLVFFSENGERFSVIMNGLRKNDTPETNVKVTGLIGAPYLVKILFADTSLGILDEKIYAIDGKERTFAIKLKKVSSTEKGFKKVGVNLGRQIEGGDKQESAAKKEQIDAQESKYVIKLVSEAALASSSNSNTNPSETNKQYQQQTAVNSNVQQTGTSTTTQVTTTSGVAGNENANVSMNVNIGGITTGTTSTTTTTTTTQSSSQAATYPDPATPNRCSYPMNDGSFESAKKSISSKSFSDSQLTMAKQVVKNNCLSCNQIKQLMLIFSFEETRLDLAKYAYDYAFDKQNYYKINDAFTFESSIDDLNEYIEHR